MADYYKNAITEMLESMSIVDLNFIYTLMAKIAGAQ